MPAKKNRIISKVSGCRAGTAKTAFLFGRLMIPAILLFIVASCTPRYIVAPPVPDAGSQKNGSSGIDVYLTSFKITNTSKTDNQSDIYSVKSKFIEYILAQNSFHDVIDATLQFSPKTGVPYVTMEAQVEPVLTKNRTWIMDILFIYPGCGYLPVPVPLWGVANVKTSLVLKDASGVTIGTYSKESPQKFNMYFYSLYRTGPMEQAFKAGYQSSFEQVSGALAQDMSRISTATTAVVPASAESDGNGPGEIAPPGPATGNKPRLLSTIYARTCFRTSFMNVAATIGGVLLPIAEGVSIKMSNNQIKNIAASNLDAKIKEGMINNTIEVKKQIIRTQKENQAWLMEADKAKQRKMGNEFEAKLGDFNVLTCLYNTLIHSKDAIKQFDISITTNSNESDSITSRIKTNAKNKPAVPYTSVAENKEYQYIASFKVQYGMGARAGREQFGFTKKYRQYIRLVGAIEDTRSNKPIWQNKIIVFGNAYEGTAAAKAVSGDDLKNNFVALCKQLSEILIHDINGDSRFSSKEEMVDWTPSEDLL